MLTSAAPQEHVFFFNGEFRAISHNAPQRGYEPQETFAMASPHSIFYAALASQTASRFLRKNKPTLKRLTTTAEAACS